MNEDERKDENGSEKDLEGEPEDPCPPGFYWDPKTGSCVPITPEKQG